MRGPPYVALRGRKWWTGTATAPNFTFIRESVTTRCFASREQVWSGDNSPLHSRVDLVSAERSGASVRERAPPVVRRLGEPRTKSGRSRATWTP